MKDTLKYLAPWMVVAAIGGAVGLAPVASAATVPAPHSSQSAVGTAGTDPIVPFGTDPRSPYVLGYHTSDHDESNTTNGQIDVPF
ncbi:hypothetical protein ACGFK1_10225 [Mycobacterium sp. NPDC048908]|uniref:hypothetical protein n=1 Tax=Mycobacterium sp. NPDC048908 TaxID=3364292 RepID=UPI00371C385F